MKKKNKVTLRQLYQNRQFLLMLLPGVVILLINNYLPMPGIILAFKDFNFADGILKSPWSGFDNFKYLFNSGKAFVITRNTVGYNVIFIVLSVIIPVIIAIMLNEIRNKKLAKVYQTIYFLPYFLSWIVVSYLLYSLLSKDYGFVNTVLLKLGLIDDSINWYTSPKQWPFILILVNMWKWAGYDTVVYLAAVCGFDRSLYEAASVDGATKLQRIRYITIPLLKPIIIILTLLKVGRIFYSDFGLFYIIPRNSGILNSVTDVIDTYVYRGLLKTGDFGMAAAAGFYQAIVGFIVVLVVNHIVRKIDPENSLF